MMSLPFPREDERSPDMTDPEKWLYIIKKVAEEQGYQLEKTATSVEIYVELKHSAAFLVKLNSADYIQVHQWEAEANKGRGEYGRAVYSLRSFSDVSEFCNMLMASARLRAARRD